MCNPRKGHVNAVSLIFGYLDKVKNYIKGRLGFDSNQPRPYTCPMKGAWTNRKDWKDLYPDAEEKFPRKMPEPLGNHVNMFTYVVANDAGNLANRRSCSGVLIYVNNAPILWLGQRQNTVKSSSFGSEYVALRVAGDIMECLRFKLRCFGINIDGVTEIVCDNKTVVSNPSVPSSILNR